MNESSSKFRAPMRLQISRVDDISLGRFTVLSAAFKKRFLVEKNGEGALNPLAVSRCQRQKVLHFD